MKNQTQSGQALILGICVLMLVGIGGTFLIRTLQIRQQESLGSTQNQAQALQKCQNLAHALNTIALHNIIVLRDLRASINTWNEAAEWSLAFSSAQPFWLSPDPEISSESVFQKFESQSMGTLRVAIANSNAAKALAENIMSTEPQLAATFAQASLETSICYALSKDIRHKFLFPTTASKCNIRTFSGFLSRFEKSLPRESGNRVGFTIPVNLASLKNWMSHCSSIQNQKTRAIVRHKKTELLLDSFRRNTSESDRIEAFLSPAWAASLSL